MKKIIAHSLSLASLALFSISAQAASEGRRAFVVNGGWGFADSSMPDATWNGGAALDIGLSPASTLGFYFDYQASKKSEATVLGISASNQVTYMPIGLTLNLYAGNFYFGANAGLMKLSSKTTVAGVSGTDSNSDISVGGQLGFDLPISAATRFGIEGRYYYIMSDPSISLMQVNGQLKFLF